MGEAIGLDRVTKRYGSRQALDAITLSIPQGIFAAILGPSGCGKSSVLKVVCGLVQADAGEVRISGQAIGSAVPPEERNLGMMFQAPTLFPHLTVAENVAFPLRARGTPAREAGAVVARLLELTHLTDYADALPRALSGGQQQRVALCRSLAFRPNVVLLDEPLSALDRPLRESLQRELREMQRTTGATFVMVTHDREEAMALADLVLIMRDGRIEQSGPPWEIYRAPANRFVAEFFAASNVLSGMVHVSSASDGGWTALAHGGLVLHAGRTQPPSSTVVEVVVRPEQVRLRRRAAGDADAWTARVDAVRFGGASALLALDSPAGRLVARVEDRDAELFRRGQIVEVTVDAAETVVLDHVRLVSGGDTLMTTA